MERVKEYKDFYRLLLRITEIVERHNKVLLSREEPDPYTDLYARSKDGIDFSKYFISGKILVYHDEIKPLDREYLLMHERKKLFGLNAKNEMYSAMEHKDHVIIKESNGNKRTPYGIFDENNKLITNGETSKGLQETIENYLLEKMYRG